jgi:hypothetical protein
MRVAISDKERMRFLEAQRRRFLDDGNCGAFTSMGAGAGQAGAVIESWTTTDGQTLRRVTWNGCMWWDEELQA